MRYSIDQMRLRRRQLVSSIRPFLELLDVKYSIFRLDDDKIQEDVLYIQNFGSPCGIIVDAIGYSDYDSEGRFQRRVGQINIPASMLNPSFYENCTLDDIKDTLIDWGYFGEINSKPSFLR
jgi:hypothetical protein